MDISLTPEVAGRIVEKVRSGRYASTEDVMAAALASLDQQESFGDFMSGELDAFLAHGEQSIETGGAIPAERVWTQALGIRGDAADGRS